MQAYSTFHIIRSSPFSVRVGGDIDREFHFTVPSGTLLNSYTLLDFQAQGELADGEDLALLFINLNGTEAYDPFSNLEQKFVRHIYKPNILKAGTRANTLTFRIETILGRGKVTLFNVVLWVKIPVP